MNFLVKSMASLIVRDNHQCLIAFVNRKLQVIVQNTVFFHIKNRSLQTLKCSCKMPLNRVVYGLPQIFIFLTNYRSDLGCWHFKPLKHSKWPPPVNCLHLLIIPQKYQFSAAPLCLFDQIVHIICPHKTGFINQPDFTIAYCSLHSPEQERIDGACRKPRFFCKRIGSRTCWRKSEEGVSL
ncbi:hypothetical protein BvCmsC16A_01065 [Escherichia coli]|nr:hypothetical protein BvCmsC16A_01065 [Escherichia coli]